MKAAFDPSLLLFVPADRPERYAKAIASGATGAILDLEDAVSPDRKAFAREQVRAFLAAGDDRARTAVRINPADGPEGVADLAMLASAPSAAAIVVPKANDRADLERVSDAAGDVPLIAIVETARGVVNCERLAATAHVLALAFGPYDLAAELGGDTSADVMLPHRARLLIAARAAGCLAIDGPSREYGDPAIPARDAEHAKRLGYDGKLLIHPAQLAPVRAAFAPTADEVAYARRIVDAAARANPAVLDGTMIDPPIILAAERVLRRVGA
ncbi:citryl-CoA lyase [Vulcanimicrobium alpinum]|uniref:Citryl-CoA lyase n=1 Tax=Vulcanimicrobium alpinum TaxID=3016050 RepID=A0AAN2C8G2_UNVUL|nr:CoA ester lyase [Vulcanimicrobium alpinum]BDE04948.1 citryl-CoA lyase [Vulcanimicrobium alpinum]